MGMTYRGRALRVLDSLEALLAGGDLRALSTEPAAGARLVAVAVAEGSPRAETSGEARCDDDGRFELELPAPAGRGARYRLRLDTGQAVRLRLGGSQPRRLERSVFRSRDLPAGDEEMTILYRVVDAADRAYLNARVENFAVPERIAREELDQEIRRFASRPGDDLLRARAHTNDVGQFVVDFEQDVPGPFDVEGRFVGKPVPYRGFRPDWLVEVAPVDLDLHGLASLGESEAALREAAAEITRSFNEALRPRLVDALDRLQALGPADFLGQPYDRPTLTLVGLRTDAEGLHPRYAAGTRIQGVIL